MHSPDLGVICWSCSWNKRNWADALLCPLAMRWSLHRMTESRNHCLDHSCLRLQKSWFSDQPQWTPWWCITEGKDDLLFDQKIPQSIGTKEGSSELTLRFSAQWRIGQMTISGVQLESYSTANWPFGTITQDMDSFNHDRIACWVCHYGGTH